MPNRHRMARMIRMTRRAGVAPMPGRNVAHVGRASILVIRMTRRSLEFFLGSFWNLQEPMEKEEEALLRQ